MLELYVFLTLFVTRFLAHLVLNESSLLLALYSSELDTATADSDDESSLSTEVLESELEDAGVFGFARLFAGGMISKAACAGCHTPEQRLLTAHDRGRYLLECGKEGGEGGGGSQPPNL